MSNNPNRNIERLEGIAQWLENGAIHVDPDTGRKFAFDMDVWETEIDDDIYPTEERPEWVPEDCGTVMCIGGAAEQFYGNAASCGEGFEYAGKLLGLDYSSATCLFYPWDFGISEDRKHTPAEAAKVIRHLIEAGEVDWMIVEDA